MSRFYASANIMIEAPSQEEAAALAYAVFGHPDDDVKPAFTDPAITNEDGTVDSFPDALLVVTEIGHVVPFNG